MKPRGTMAATMDVPIVADETVQDFLVKGPGFSTCYSPGDVTLDNLVDGERAGEPEVTGNAGRLASSVRALPGLPVPRVE